MSKPSNELTNRIIHEIYSTGGFAWRAESTGVMDAKRGIMRTAPKKGVADILAVYKSRFIAIEIKIGTDKLSPEQEGFLENIEHVGGYTYVAKEFDNFRLWWQETKVKIDLLP